jgi:hypothetical protein
MLPDPKLGWVNMLYRVRGGRDGGGLIEIYANDRFVGRVIGPIGYKGGAGDRQYFKIGNYRNFISGEAQLEVDLFWRGEELPKVRPALQARPMKRIAASCSAHSSRYMMCRPTRPWVGWAKAPGRVPTMLKPRRL